MSSLVWLEQCFVKVEKLSLGPVCPVLFHIETRQVFVSGVRQADSKLDLDERKKKKNSQKQLRQF